MKGTKTKAPRVPQAFIEMIGDHFLEAARYLREIQDEHPENFVSVARKLKIGRRKAYALARIDRHFHDLGIAPDRLRRIGWTKLQIIASRIDEVNHEELLDLAETHSAYELKKLMDGEEPDPDARCVVLYLAPDQYEIFQLAITAYGGVKSGKGLGDKEAALTEALAKLLSSSHSD